MTSYTVVIKTKTQYSKMTMQELMHEEKMLDRIIEDAKKAKKAINDIVYGDYSSGVERVIVNMRKNGYSWKEVTKIVGINEYYARKMYKHAVESEKRLKEHLAYVNHELFNLNDNGGTEDND